MSSLDNRDAWLLTALAAGLQLAGWTAAAFGGGHLSAVRPWSWPVAYLSGTLPDAVLAVSGAVAAAPVVAAVWAGRALRQPLHGDARFATRREVNQAGLLASDGLILGRFGGRFLVSGGSTHVLVSADTRSGKGVGIVVPNLLTWRHSAVVLDIKHENHATTSGYRARHGQACYLFDPVSPTFRTYRYNPLAYIDDHPLRAVNDIQKIGQLLYPDIDGTDPIWTATPRSLFCGIVMLLRETPGRLVTLGQVLRESLVEGDGAAYFARTVRDREAQGNPLSPLCVQFLSSYSGIDAAETRSGIIASLRSRLELWANPLIDAATSANDFDLRKLRSTRMSVYVGVTPDNLARLEPLLNLFFQQLFDLNSRLLPEHDPAYRHEALVLLDEMAALGRIPILAKGVAYVAAYGLRILPIVQSPYQIEDIYGEAAARNFMLNHAVQVIFPPKATEMHLAKQVSEWLGDRTVAVSSRSEPRAWWRGESGSTSTSEHKRALLLPQEVVSLGARRQLVVAKDCRPIKARRIVYHRERAFVRRLAEVAPDLYWPGGWLVRPGAVRQAVKAGRLAAPVPLLDLTSYQHAVGAFDSESAAFRLASAAARELDRFQVDFSAISKPDPARLDDPAALLSYADQACRVVGIPVR